MKTTTRIAVCLFLLATLTTWNSAQETTTSTITITVPYKDLMEATKVMVNGKKIEGEDGKHTYKVEVEKGKEYKFKVECVIVPNNYEVITRYKEIILKGGADTNVDLTVKNANDKVKARWVPTPDDIVDAMSRLAKIGKTDVVYDLGCGDSVMLIRPIQKFGAALGVGIDIDPKMVAISKEKVKKAGLTERIDVRQGDILDLKSKDLANATVVLLYIGDELGERIGPVLSKGLKPGARIVSHRFKLGDWAPTKTVTVKGGDGAEYELHLWIVGAKKLEKGKDR